MPIPDSSGSTVRLFVTLADGHCKLTGGRPLPKLKPDTYAELLLSPFDIEDELVRAQLMSRRTISFLPVGTKLWVRVKKDDIVEQLAEHRQSKQVWPCQPAIFVSFTLSEELMLLVRGGKNAVLCDCKNEIPSLGEHAEIVNEAATKISTAFEPSRRSHAGNVFSCVFYQEKNHLHPLNRLRLLKESEAAITDVPVK